MKKMLIMFTTKPTLRRKKGARVCHVCISLELMNNHTLFQRCWEPNKQKPLKQWDNLQASAEKKKKKNPAYSYFTTAQISSMKTSPCLCQKTNAWKIRSDREELNPPLRNANTAHRTRDEAYRLQSHSTAMVSNTQNNRAKAVHCKHVGTSPRCVKQRSPVS